MRNAYIGIDLGTSGCRVIAIDDHADIISQKQQAIPTPSLTPPKSEHDPYCLWEHVLTTLTPVVADCQDYYIQAIAVDATSGSVLVCDQQGHPLTPLVMYNDTRAVEQSDRIAHIAPVNAAVHGQSSGLATLMYLQQHNTFPKGSVMLHQADWIAFNLGAPIGISDYNNALKTGYDPINQCWPEWIDALTDMALLPEVVAPGMLIGTLSKSLCRQLTLANAPQIYAGTTDSIAGLLATGAHKVGDAVTSLGSTLVVKLISNKPLFIAEQGIYSHRLGDNWLVGGASNTGGAVLKHYFDNQRLELLSQQINLAKAPVDYYPLLSPGERFPVNDPHLQPRLTPRPDDDVDFLHGLLAGIAKIEQQAYQCLQDAGATPLISVRTVGGGAINNVWHTLRKKYINVPFVTAKHTDAAYGAALLAQGGFNRE